MKFVQSSSREVNAANLQDWIKYFTSNIQPELIELEAFYNAKDDINKGHQKVDNDRPDNNIHVNLAKMVTRNATSYFVGKPVTYTFNKKDAETAKVEKVIFDTNEEQENKSLAKDSSKFGVAYELMGVGTDKLLYVKNLSPLTTFQVIDDSILEEPICVVTYLTITDKNNVTRIKGWVYDPISIYEFTCGSDFASIQLREIGINPFYPKIPVSIFPNNDDYTGDYEDVTELLSAYSRLISNNFDDIEGILNAILAFYETEIDEEEAKKLNKTRVVSLISQDEKRPARAEFLVKNLDEAYCKYLREAIREDIFTITNVPDFTDDSFAGNQSGVALSYKLIGFENLRLDKQSYFEAGLYNRIELILNYKQFNDSPIIVNKSDIDIQFYANLPANIDKDGKIVELYNAGGISRETMIENLEIVKDKEEEIKRLEQEKPNLEAI